MSYIKPRYLSSRRKTVYILGAGFSIEASAPQQADLIRKIIDLKDIFEGESFNQFQSFLRDSLQIPEKIQKYVPLEDVFTPLDRCIADNLSFRNLSNEEVFKMRETAYYLIGKTIQHLLQESDKAYIDKFAEHLSGMDENFSVISTNWDILLDNSLSDRAIEVDYCCNVYPLFQHSQQEEFRSQIKFLKVHGSLNWLQCPRCLRVYAQLGSKIAIDQYENRSKCRFCQSNFGDEKSHTLVSNLIMPTFLKDLSNFQYKLIWQQAGIELSEADKIVFIGYSLPYADFEMRQLLSRMVKDSTRVSVVDYAPKNSSIKKELQNRYKVFFGKRHVDFFWRGASDFVNQLCR